MPTGGLCITVPDEDVLRLSLAHGVYGPTLRVDLDGEPYPDPYMRTLADIGCPRRANHVFFRCDRRLSYGGRIVGDSDEHPFYLNGDRGIVGNTADAPLVWDETRWDAFAPPGRDQYRPPLCQPFLIHFRDWLDLKGRWIHDHAYYVALGDHNHLLPTTADASGITPMSPGETDHLLSVLMQQPDGRLEPPVDHDIAFVEDPLPYGPASGPTMTAVHTAADLVAVAIANPGQLPDPLPPAGAAVGHHVPISPHRPRHVERVELGYYTDRRLLDGTLPDTLLYLSLEPGGAELRKRIDRQFAWLETLLGDDVHRIDRYVGAPGFETDFDTALERPEGSFEVVELPGLG